MPKFRKKPIVIEAVQMDDTFTVDTLEGQMVGQAGDWLITGINGEKYPCKDEIFRKTYGPVETDISEFWRMFFWFVLLMLTSVVAALIVDSPLPLL
jgi:hypothetical protein